MDKQELNLLSKEILDASMAVHKEMGPGLLESVYESCLLKELQLRNIFAENQVPIPLYYKGILLNKDFRIDILVEKEIILELNRINPFAPLCLRGEQLEI